MNGFSFMGIHSSTFGVYYIPDESSLFDDRSDYEVYDEDVDWHDGGIYYGRKAKPREFPLDCYYEDIPRKTYEKMKQWLSGKQSGRLVFDDKPWKYYDVYITKKPSGKQYSQHEHGMEPLYSGTFSITFTAYEPFGKLEYSSYDTIDTDGIGVNSKYDTSSISCSTPVDFGNTSSVSFSNSQLSALNHRVTWKINDSYQYTMTTATGASSAVYQIPTSWLASCPQTTSIECTVTVETLYNNNFIGDTSKPIILNVPNNIVPTIGGFAAAIYNDTSANYFATQNGVFIQNLCGATFTVSNVSAGTGSSIAALTFSSTSEDEGSQNWNVYTITKFGHSGKMSFTITAKDQRGRVASTSLSISVIPYNQPVITAYDAYRCKADGTGSESGTYDAAIRCAASVSPVVINGTARNAAVVNSVPSPYALR